MKNKELNSIIDSADHAAIVGNYDEADRLVNEVLAVLDASPSLSAEEHRDEALLRAKILYITAHSTMKRSNFELALEQAHTVLAVNQEFPLGDVLPKVRNLIGVLYQKLGMNDNALKYCIDALADCEALGDKTGIAMTMGSLGGIYDDLGLYDKAFEYLTSALNLHLELRNTSRIANTTMNIGILHYSLGSYDKALDFFTQALAIHSEVDDKSGISDVLSCIGNAYVNLGFYDKAMENYSTALATYELIGDTSGANLVRGNMGHVYLNLEQFDKALEFFRKALARHETLGEKYYIASVIGNIGYVYSIEKFEGYDPIQAEMHLLDAVALSSAAGAKSLLLHWYKTLADVYEKEKRDAEALSFFKKYIELKDELNIADVKKRDEIREQQNTILLAQARTQATDEILANILPPTIVERLIKGEKKIAETLENVSVLFIDIVGFTKMSGLIPAAELIDLLDVIFSRFDSICKKHGLEKIKTIGDAYMAASGAPIPCSNHAERAAFAAFEMLEDWEIDRQFSTEIDLDFRIGLHTGSVVAGIIGENKYSYDLWGDAVNTASRMESHGEPGKIHVSEEFLKKLLMVNGEWLMEEADDFSSFTINNLPLTTNNHSSLIINNLPLTIIPRGEMEIKGKGTMNTYFLESK